MKRLIKKSNSDLNQDEIVNVDTIQRIRQEVLEDIQNTNPTNMVMLNELDEADVRHDKCPNCKYRPLARKDGFKVCPSCTNVFKMLDGTGYMVVE